MFLSLITKIIRHTDTLVCLQWYVLVLTLKFAVYRLFGKNKIKFMQKYFCIPKNMHSRTLMPLPFFLISTGNWLLLCMVAFALFLLMKL